MNEVEILRAACCVCAADGVVTEAERRVIDRLAEKAGVGRPSVDAMVDLAKNDKDFFQSQFSRLVGDADRALTVLAMAVCADKKVSPEERTMFNHFANKLGVSLEHSRQILDRIVVKAKEQGAFDEDAEA